MTYDVDEFIIDSQINAKNQNGNPVYKECKKTGILMPLSHQIHNFFFNDAFLNNTLENMKLLENKPNLKNFIQGDL